MYHKKNLREDIIHYSLNLIRESGYQNLTLRGIAKELNVSPTAVYRHFININDLFQELLHIESQAISSVIFEDIDKAMIDIDKIVLSGSRLVQYAKKEANRFDFIFLSQYSNRNVVINAKMDFPLMDRFVELVASFKETYHLSSSLEILISQLWGFILGYAIIVRESEIEFNQETIKDLVYRIANRELEE